MSNTTMKLPNLSYDAVNADLKAYLAARADVGAWRSVYESGAGTTIRELLAGLATYTSFHSMAARREAFLTVARLTSSIFNEAAGIGYAINGPSAPLITVQISSEQTLIFPKEQVVAYYKGVPLVLKQGMTISQGENILELVAGQWNKFSMVAVKSANYQSVFIEDPLIDNRINELTRLSVNGVQCQLTANVEDLMPGETPSEEELVDASAAVDTDTREITVQQQYLKGEAVVLYPYYPQAIAKLSGRYLYLQGHGLDSGTSCRFSSSGTLPAGISPGVEYFLRATTEDNLTVHTTRAGALANTHKVNFTTVGVGKITLDYGQSLPLPFRQGMIYYVSPQEGGKVKLCVSYQDATATYSSGVQIRQGGVGTMRIIAVPYGTTLAENEVLIRRAADGAYLLFGDGVFGRKLLNNDTVDLEYIQPMDVLGATTVFPADIELAFPGTVMVVTALERGTTIDDKEKVRYCAPGYFSSKRVMRNRLDHKFIFLGWNGSMISANASKKGDPTCCTVQMAYLMRANVNGTQRIATPAERQDMMVYLDKFRLLGEALEIVDPVRVTLQMRVVVVVDDDTVLDSLEEDMILTIDKFCNKLGDVFHVGEVTDALASLKGVARIYMHYPQSDYVTAWNEYVWLDQVFFRTNLLIYTDTTHVEQVTDSTHSGYSR